MAASMLAMAIGIATSERWLGRRLASCDSGRRGQLGAQVSCQYGASLEESEKKVKCGVYYINHMSLSLDLLILPYSMKVIMLGRGSR